MRPEDYELLSMAAKYWFALLATLIVFRAWRAHVRDRRAASVSRDVRESEACVAELVVLSSPSKGLARGARFPLSRDCAVGSSGAMDVRIEGMGIRKRHARIERRVGGFALYPIGGAAIAVEGQGAPPYFVKDDAEFSMGGVSFEIVPYDLIERRDPRGSRFFDPAYDRLRRGSQRRERERDPFEDIRGDGQRDDRPDPNRPRFDDFMDDLFGTEPRRRREARDPFKDSHGNGHRDGRRDPNRPRFEDFMSDLFGTEPRRRREALDPFEDARGDGRREDEPEDE